MSNNTARAEDRALYRMLGDENTVEELRELIAVPPRIERALCAYARAHPEEGHFVDRAIKFRQAVAREFERLVREGVPSAELPDPGGHSGFSKEASRESELVADLLGASVVRRVGVSP